MSPIFKKIAEFQKLFSGVSKTRQNEFTHSKYANLEDVTNAATPILVDVGISVCYIPKVVDGIQLLITILYDEEDKIESEVNITGLMPKPEAIRFGSALTYARRYSLCCMLNILTYDDDGSAAGHADIRPATKEQKEKIHALMAEKNTDPDKINDFIKNRGWGESVEDLGFRAAAVIIGMLKKKEA